MNLSTLLDETTAEISAVDNVSDETAALRAVRLNLQALVGVLIDFGSTGRDLPNSTLESIVGGLLDTVTWMAARDAISTTWSEIENFANGEG